MYSLRAILTKQPVAIAGTLRAILHVLVLAGILAWDAELLAGVSLVAELVLGLLVWQNVTPTGAPTLAPGTVVDVAGSSDSVVIAPSPPGPIGLDAP